MLKSEYALYLGAETENVIVDFIVEDTVFIVVETEGDIDKQALKEILASLKDELHSLRSKSLSSFSTLVAQKLAAKGDGVVFSYAAGLVVDTVLYVVTKGQGLVLMHKNKRLETLIESDTSASGFVEGDDVVVLTTRAFLNLAGTDVLSAVIEGKEPKGIVDELTPRLKEHDDQGAIAIFVRFAQEDLSEEDTPVLTDVDTDQELSDQSTPLQPTPSLFDRAGAIIHMHSRKKKITAGVVVILFMILLWSVVFGWQRRQHDELVKHVEEVSVTIDTKLEEAQDLFTLNPDKALALLAEAKAEYKSLQQATKNEDIKQVTSIGKKIAVAEKSIKREKDTDIEEFFDLNLIEKGAHGDMLYREGDLVAILNSDAGEIYTLSLSKKSTDRFSDTTIRDASLVTLSDEQVLFFSKKRGIYKAQEEKPQRVVPADKDLKSPIDFWTYNGNLYLLDSTSGGLYKYLVAEEGYSNKTKYFKGEDQPDMSGALAMAIDSSIYVLLPSGVRRYTAGLDDGFHLSVPDDDITFENLYTDKDTQDLYLIDTDSGRMYVFSKTGEFKKQFASNILKTADDFFVSEGEGGVFVLVDNLIYKISLK